MKHNWTPKESGISFSMFVLIYFGGTLILALAGELAGFNLEKGSIEKLVANSLLLALLPLASYIFAAYTDTNWISAVKADSGMNIKTALKCVALVLLCIVAFVPLSVLFTKLCSGVSLTEKTELATGTGSISPVYFVLSIFFTGILTAFSEETAFRGVIAGGLKPAGMPFAALTCALFFMLMHATPAQTVYQFLMGLVMAVLFLKSNSLWPGIIVHSLNNIIILTVDFILSEVKVTGFAYEAVRYLFYDCDLIISVFAAPAAAAGIFFLLKSVKPLKKEKYPPAEEFDKLRKEETEKEDLKWEKIAAAKNNETYIENRSLYVSENRRILSKYSMSRKQVYLYALIGLLITAEMWIESFIRLF